MFAWISTIALVSGLSAPQEVMGAPSSTRANNRQIKTFDFDERKLGNFESMPMNWLPIMLQGYPRFGEMHLDEKMGHLAPPSFKFPLRGGNIGAYYIAKDIPVDPNSDYRISAWVRPDRLSFAHAVLEAYYIDAALRIIEKSTTACENIAGVNSDGTWRRIVIDLPSGFETARWLGLRFRILQPDQKKSEHAINRQDVVGGAWLDDITVTRLPQVAFKIESQSHIFLSDTPIVCKARVSDLNGQELTVSLTVSDADGRRVQHHVFDSSVYKKTVAIPIRNLPAGLYTALLETKTDSEVLSSDSLSFLCLNPIASPRQLANRGFGIYASPKIFSDESLNRTLLHELAANIIKLPLWHSGLTADDIVKGPAGLSDFVDHLEEDGTKVVAVLDRVPKTLANDYPAANRSLMDVLASDPGKWRPYISFILTRFGQRVNAWQIGPDQAALEQNPRPLSQAIAHLKTEMQPLIGMPRLVFPSAISQQLPGSEIPADIASFTLRNFGDAAQLASARNTLQKRGIKKFWVSIAPADSGAYDRVSRNVDFIRTMIAARFAGADAIFVPQPWKIETLNGKSLPTFDEEFVFIRTLSHALNGFEPVQEIKLHDNVEGFLFANGSTGKGSLVVYTFGQQPKPTLLTLDLNEGARVIDMWANRILTSSSSKEIEISVDAMPLIIQDVDIARMKMIVSFRLKQNVVNAGERQHRTRLEFANPGSERLTGRLRLRALPGWRVNPTSIPVDLAPGESKAWDIVLRMPSNQPAGMESLRAELQTATAGSICLRAPLKVDAPGLDVNVMAYRSDDEIKIVQRITNRTPSSMSLRTYLLAPNRARDARTIRDLAAGQSTIREFAVPNATDLAGQHLRVSVEQIGGQLKYNEVIPLK